MNTVNNLEQTQTQTAPAQPVEYEHEYMRPMVNIYETAEGYVLEAELPGVKKDGLSVNVENNLLTVEGRRAAPALPESEMFYRETSAADFRRVFELDPVIETAKISARLEEGMLTLTLPRAEAAKPRKITVA